MGLCCCVPSNDEEIPLDVRRQRALNAAEKRQQDNQKRGIQQGESGLERQQRRVEELEAKQRTADQNRDPTTSIATLEARQRRADEAERNAIKSGQAGGTSNLTTAQGIFKTTEWMDGGKIHTGQPSKATRCQMRSSQKFNLFNDSIFTFSPVKQEQDKMAQQTKRLTDSSYNERQVVNSEQYQNQVIEEIEARERAVDLATDLLSPLDWRLNRSLYQT